MNKMMVYLCIMVYSRKISVYFSAQTHEHLNDKKTKITNKIRTGWNL